MGTYARGQVACMMRIRNEARWIRSILERAFHLVGSIVVLDDGSDDETILECLRAVYQDDALAQEAYEGTRDALSTTGYYVWDVTQTAANVRDVELTPAARVLHVLQSPFRPATAGPVLSGGGSKGGSHRGSIPRENFRPNGVDPVAAISAQRLIRFGYWDGEDRQRKFEFYNRIDPGNTFEGEYRHIIGQPHQHAPGPVVLVPWEDQE